MGPASLKDRLVALQRAYGDWVLDPGFPLNVTEIGAGSSVELSDGVWLEAFKTPHTEHSVAYAVRDKETFLVYTGDTGASTELAQWASGCDLMLAECSLPDARGIDVHLTPTSAGELARVARAKRLVLTHFYPVFGDSDPSVDAARAFGAAVDIAHDGARFHVEGSPR
jgi:ribonuclease BN (tRNA processing enzyme)